MRSTLPDGDAVTFALRFHPEAKLLRPRALRVLPGVCCATTIKVVERKAVGWNQVTQRAHRQLVPLSGHGLQTARLHLLSVPAVQSDLVARQWADLQDRIILLLVVYTPLRRPGSGVANLGR